MWDLSTIKRINRMTPAEYQDWLNRGAVVTLTTLSVRSKNHTISNRRSTLESVPLQGKGHKQ